MNKALSPRGFVGPGVASGLAYKIGFIGTAAEAAIVGEARSQHASLVGPDGTGRFTTDADADVTGAKTFARDDRARDMPGWPAQQNRCWATSCCARRRLERQ